MFRIQKISTIQKWSMPRTNYNYSLRKVLLAFTKKPVPSVAVLPLLVFVVFFLQATVSARAAECDVSIAGEINQHVIDRAIEELKSFDARMPGESVILCLDSPGGDLAAAIHFIEFMNEEARRSNGISTYVPPNAKCVSSCSFILLSGFICGSRFCYIDRAMHRTAEVGFHAPFLKGKPVSANAEYLQSAYAAAVSIIKRISDNFSSAIHFRDSHLRLTSEMLVEIISTPANEILSLQTIGDLIKYKIRPVGEYTVSNINVENFITACDNEWLWMASDSRVTLFEGYTRENKFFKGRDAYRKGIATIASSAHYALRLWGICEFHDSKTESGEWTYHSGLGENSSIITEAEGVGGGNSVASYLRLSETDFLKRYKGGINAKNFWMFMDARESK